MREDIIQLKQDIIEELNGLKIPESDSSTISVGVTVESILGTMPLSFSVAVPFGRDLVEFKSIKGEEGIQVKVHKNLSSVYKPWDVMRADHFNPKPTEALFGTSDQKLTMTGQTPTAGAIGIISDASGGKSSLVWDFVANEGENVGVQLLNIGEPESLTSGSMYDVFLGLLICMSKGSKVMLVDSLREILLSVPGDLRTGGVSKGVPPMLTTFERLAKVCEVMVVVILNPSDSVDDEETDFTEGRSKRAAFKQLVSDMRSSMSHTVRITKTLPVEQGFLPLRLAVSSRYTGRDWRPLSARVMLPGTEKIAELERKVGGSIVNDDLESLIDDISEVQLTGRFDDVNEI